MSSVSRSRCEAGDVAGARRAQLHEALEPLAIAPGHHRDDPGRAIEGPGVVEREEQPIVAERHEAVEAGEPGAHLGHQRRELGIGRRDPCHGRVHGAGGHGAGSRRLLALELAGLDRQLDLPETGEERALLAGQTRRLRLGLGQAGVEDLGRRLDPA